VSGLANLEIVVAGAGALGSATAWTLQRAGARVVLVDPAPTGDNASGVAAGMLAPAFESLLDETSRDHFPLLRDARDAWPGLLEGLGGAEITHSGALWVGDEASQAEVRSGLAALGAEVQALTASQALEMAPGLLAPEGCVYTPEDRRLDPIAMLAALRAGFLAAGGRALAGTLRAAGDGRAVLADGSVLRADAVVLATGLAPETMPNPPRETLALTPIKGQIVRCAWPAAPRGAVVRAKGLYVTPTSDGVAVGSTMEEGRADRSPDPAVLERLRGQAARLFPDLASAPTTGAAGVRASSPDGLPLVGPSSIPGVWLALGARRNGWLLAPLIAQVVAESLAGAARSPRAAAFSPSRFAAPVSPSG
jgi:glycine oxidase